MLNECVLHIKNLSHQHVKRISIFICILAPVNTVRVTLAEHIPEATTNATGEGIFHNFYVIN